MECLPKQDFQLCFSGFTERSSDVGSLGILLTLCTHVELWGHVTLVNVLSHQNVLCCGLVPEKRKKEKWKTTGPAVLQRHNSPETTLLKTIRVWEVAAWKTQAQALYKCSALPRDIWGWVQFCTVWTGLNISHTNLHLPPSSAADISFFSLQI